MIRLITRRTASALLFLPALAVIACAGLTRLFSRISWHSFAGFERLHRALCRLLDRIAAKGLELAGSDDADSEVHP